MASGLRIAPIALVQCFNTQVHLFELPLSLGSTAGSLKMQWSLAQ